MNARAYLLFHTIDPNEAANGHLVRAMFETDQEADLPFITCQPPSLADLEGLPWQAHQ